MQSLPYSNKMDTSCPLKQDVRCKPPYSKTGTSIFGSDRKSQERRNQRRRVCEECARAYPRVNGFGKDEYYFDDMKATLNYIDSKSDTDLLGINVLERLVDAKTALNRRNRTRVEQERALLTKAELMRRGLRAGSKSRSKRRIARKMRKSKLRSKGRR